MKNTIYCGTQRVIPNAQDSTILPHPSKFCFVSQVHDPWDVRVSRSENKITALASQTVNLGSFYGPNVEQSINGSFGRYGWKTRSPNGLRFSSDTYNFLLAGLLNRIPCVLLCQAKCSNI